MRNDADETARFATAGELLASHVANATQIARAAVAAATVAANRSSAVRLFAWADMFNPDHNSGDHYFLVNGTLEGAWKGVEPGLPGVTMMTWGPCNDSAPSAPGVPACKYRQGLEFFAAKGIHQFLGGYYVRVTPTQRLLSVVADFDPLRCCRTRTMVRNPRKMNGPIRQGYPTSMVSCTLRGARITQAGFLTIRRCAPTLKSCAGYHHRNTVENRYNFGAHESRN